VSWTISGTASFNGNTTSGSQAVTAGTAYTYTIAAGGSLTITWANTESGPFTPTLPALKTTLAGTVGHVGAFNEVLPAPKTTLTGTVGHVGSFGQTLPVVTVSLQGTVSSANVGASLDMMSLLHRLLLEEVGVLD